MQVLSQQSQFTAFFAVRTYFQAACGAKCGNFFKFGNVCVDNGSGAIFGVSLGFADVAPLIFVLAPGAFLVLGYLMVLFNKLAKK